jgi:hypothetical protein
MLSAMPKNQKLHTALNAMSQAISTMAYDLAKSRAEQWALLELLPETDPTFYVRLAPLRNRDEYRSIRNAYTKHLSDVSEALDAIREEDN